MYGTTSTVQIEIVHKMLLVSVTQPNVGSSLAQLVERETVNLEVVSSILTGREMHLLLLVQVGSSWCLVGSVVETYTRRHILDVSFEHCGAVRVF